MNILSIILIGVSLSMDAFSLSLLYGSKGIKKQDISKLTICVGIFHFIMPLIGCFLGSIILKFIRINTKILVFIILSIIGLEMIIDGIKKKDTKGLRSLEIFTFSFAVSIDSFSVGIGLTSIVRNIIISPIIFAITSALFTFLGLKLGKVLSEKFGSIATIFGGVSLIVLGLSYIM